MAYQIKKAAVLGSGVMGSGIAAHLANIGIPVLLLDIVPKEVNRRREKRKDLHLEDQSSAKQNCNKRIAKIIETKTSTTNYKKQSYHSLKLVTLKMILEKLKDVDWIIEVIVENLRS